MFNNRRQKYLVAVIAIALVTGGGVITRALFLGGGGAPQSSSDIDLSRGLIGWWKLNGNARDSTPYSRNGTITGSPTAASDRNGIANSAYSFSGTGQYISVPNFDNTVLSQGYESANWTLSVWATGGGQNGVLFGKVGWNGGILQSSSNYSFSIYSSSDTSYTISKTASTSQWNLLTAVYSAGTMYFYVNGQLAGSKAGPATIYPYTTTLGIGSGGTNNWLTNATLSDARVYSRAISAAEVTALYNEYNPSLNIDSSQRGLVGWWKLDGDAKDSSPYGSNGTLNGGPVGGADRGGKTNGAMTFNGTSQYISVPASRLPTSAITVSLWVNQSTLVNYYDLAINNWTTEGSWDLFTLGNGQVVFGIYHSSAQYNAMCNAGTLTTNSWHHLVGTYDGSTVRVYFDGSQCSTTNAVSGVALRNSGSWTIGEHAAGSSTHSIDDVRVYNRALSASDVSNLYSSYDSNISLYRSTNSGTNVNLSSGLVGEWDFNGNARDATPYGDNGTVSGATLTADRNGRANSAYQLGDSSAWINVGSPTVLNGANGLTYNIWLERAGASVYHWPEIMGSSNTHVNYGIRSGNYGDGIYFEYGKSPYDGSVFAGTSAITLPTNQWHMYSITYDGSTLKEYWDGVLKQTVSSVTLDPTFGGMTFTTSANGWNGAIDDARVWNRALSQNEVTDLYSVYR